ncbi:g3359 [Coccomyxa elongata]
MCVLLTEEYKVLQGGGNSPYQKDNMLHWAPKEQQRLSWQHPYQHFQPATRDPFGVARQAMHFNTHRSSASNGNVHCRFQSAQYGIRGQPDELDIITDGCQFSAPMRLHVHRKSVPPARPASTTLLHPTPKTAHSGAGHISSSLLALYGAVWQPSEYAFGFLSSLCGVGSGYLNSGLRGVCSMMYRPSGGAYLSRACHEAVYMGSGRYRTSGTPYEGAADDRGSPRPSRWTPTANTKSAAPAAPKEQKHRYKASVVSRGYRQLMDRDAQVAAQQALTQQEDAEMLDSIADLASAGEETCAVAGAKLCCEAYFVLEGHERGETSGKLLGILFLWAEQTLQHQPDSACKVLQFAVEMALALKEDTSIALFSAAFSHRPQCALAFAKLELDASKARIFQLSVLRHISDDAADISDAVMLRAALLVRYLVRNPAAEFLRWRATSPRPAWMLCG